MPMAATPAATPVPNAFSGSALKAFCGGTMSPNMRPSGPPLMRTEMPRPSSSSTSATSVTDRTPAASVIEKYVITPMISAPRMAMMIQLIVMPSGAKTYCEAK